MSSAVQTIQEILASVSQEITAIVVFFISLALHRHLSKRSKAAKQQQSTPSKSSQFPASTKKLPPAPVIETLDAADLQAIQTAEKQLLQLLDQREFTRALNNFRSFERDGRDRHFSQALFSAFIQSSIRVGKIDVVE